VSKDSYTKNAVDPYSREICIDDARIFKCSHCGYNISFKGVDERIVAIQSHGFSKVIQEKPKKIEEKKIESLDQKFLDEKILKTGTRSARRRKLREAREAEERKKYAHLFEKKEEPKEEEIKEELKEEEPKEEVPKIIEREAMDVTTLKKVSFILFLIFLRKSFINLLKETSLLFDLMGYHF